MSGISGIVCADGAAPDQRVLGRMAALLSCRGPDGTNVWSDGAAGFCHSLLHAGPSPRGEQQPFSLDGISWIVADARLDARGDLRAKLRDRGCAVPASSGDAELILHAWRIWGGQCLEHLDGDFAFAIWDKKAQRLWCARDRFGVKPFYYARRGDALVFSNTLDCIRLHPAGDGQLNEWFLADFLLSGWNPNPAATVFAGIARLPAAHSLSWQQGSLQVTRYWTLPIEDILRYATPQEYLEQFRELLRRAVEDRLPEGGAGLQLSGGLDSTSVAATAKEVARRCAVRCSLRAYTFDYRPLFQDEEAIYAAQAAQMLSIPLRRVSVAEALPYARWEDPCIRQPEPAHEPFLELHHRHLSEAAGHHRVLLTGEGGDPSLLGETWPYLVSLFRRLRWMTLVRDLGSYFLSHRRIPPLLGGFRMRVRRGFNRQDLFADYPPWLNPAFEKRLKLRDRWLELQREEKQVPATRPQAYAAMASSYWASLFEADDPGASGIAIEARAPLFALPLVRFMLRLPPLPWCAHKELLRQAMKGALPDSILKRPKSPLAADPLVELLRQKIWKPLPLPRSAPEISNYVVADRVPHEMETLSPGEIWTHLRPLSLYCWLRRATGLTIAGATKACYEAC